MSRYTYETSKVDATTWMVKRIDADQRGWTEALLRDVAEQATEQEVIQQAIDRGSWADRAEEKMPDWVCNGPFGDEEECPVHGAEIRAARGRTATQPRELSEQWAKMACEKIACGAWGESELLCNINVALAAATQPRELSELLDDIKMHMTKLDLGTGWMAIPLSEWQGIEKRLNAALADQGKGKPHWVGVDQAKGKDWTVEQEHAPPAKGTQKG